MENEKRSYIREEQFYSKFKISKDQKHWQDGKIFDLSAGGLKFYAVGDFKIGDTLWFDITIHYLVFQSKMRLEGEIRREENHQNHETLYGVAFKNLSPEMGIQIDEIILLKKRFLNDE